MQFKSLVNPSFLVLMLDVQDHLKAGWEIDPNNLPVDNFMFKEVHLIKDDEDSVVEVFGEGDEDNHPEFGSVIATVKKAPGRPAKVK